MADIKLLQNSYCSGCRCLRFEIITNIHGSSFTRKYIECKV